MPDGVNALIRKAAQEFSRRGIETAALDARLLLQASAKLTHADIVADPDTIPAAPVVETFWSLVERRCAHEPVSRILGEREFYGRAFKVTPAVLDPRGDTETLITAALSLGREMAPYRILDLGTGSGAIIVTLLAELAEATGVATDISADALAVAHSNSRTHGVSDRLEFVQTSWFNGLSGRFDLIVSNPPYIPTGDIADLAEDVRDYDPPAALDGGITGVEPYVLIAAVAGRFLAGDGRILVEIGMSQETRVEDIFRAAGFVARAAYRDMGGHVRVLSFNLPR